ncbi:hypothetical protein [Massilia niastensis]|uniref:hypothetical protein n=1 Tax=Massilia niastensis TaxID=544911 RepID=UPI00036A47F4|nr:hypothetical protein [Massilia niastensis]
MARDAWAYREVAVESAPDPRSGALRIRPMAGQAFATSMRVQCARALSDPARYPAGTRFLLSVKITDRQGGEPFLYAWHGDPVRILTKAQARVFLEQYRRLRL